MKTVQALAAVLLVAWTAVTDSTADPCCHAGPYPVSPPNIQLAEARTPLASSEAKTICRRFESNQEARNVGNWSALDIVPTDTPASRELVEAELQRIGGVRLVLQIDSNALYKDLIERARDEVRRRLRAAKIPIASGIVIRGDSIQVRLKDSTAMLGARRATEWLTSKPFPELEVRSAGSDTDAQPILVLVVTQQTLAAQMETAEHNTVEYISRRLRELGHETFSHQSLGGGRFLAIVPGMTEPERLWQLMPSRARLDFQIANGAADPCTGAAAPADSEVVTDETRERALLVRQHRIADGQDVAVVVVARDPQTRSPAVAIRVNARASSRLYAATRDSSNQRLAILLDRQVIAAPAIREPIENGMIWISGDLTLQQAKDLAILVRAGALLPSLTVVERQIVEPAKPR